MARPVRRTRLIVALSSLAVLGAVATAGTIAFQHGDGPYATWRFGPDHETVGPFEDVPMADPVNLELSLPFKAWIYTVCFSLAQGPRALFPSDYLATDVQNPLPAGTHRLPGRLEGKDLTWVVPSCKNQAVSYLLVVSRKPLPDLQNRMSTFFQIGNTAFSDRSFGSYMPKGGKTVLPKQNRVDHPLLKQAAWNREAVTDGPMFELKDHPGVFIRAMHVVPKEQRRKD
jgi:hypothetical protein